jgi:predicted amidophosphoribosyltransferase
MRIVLVDDVYTTGATVAAATRVLRKAGALDITVLTFARALPEPI